MPPTPEQVLEALRRVEDPDLKKDLVTLRMVKDIRIEGDDVVIGIELTTPACPMKDKIRGDIEAAVAARAVEAGTSVGAIRVDFTADVRPPNERVRDKDSPLPSVRHIIAVGAGKGGVGKSTIAVNLAVGLARQGARTGILDGDIYGPSLTTMLGLESMAPPQSERRTLIPFETHGVRAMTIGKLFDPDKALVWRGPMAHKAFQQLATETEWGELDYLIVDLPPGTGDVPLTLSQLLPLTGAVIVCTPQKVAQDDARRAIRMFQQLGVEVLGMVENMSTFICEHGTEYDLFGRGGAETLAQSMNLPFLGALPIHPALGVNADAGDPTANFESPVGPQLERLVQNLAAQISIASMSGRLVQPTLDVR